MINDGPLFILVTRRLIRAKVTKIHYKPEIVTEVAIINEVDQSLKHTYKNEACSSIVDIDSIPIWISIVLVSIWIRVVINGH